MTTFNNYIWNMNAKIHASDSLAFLSSWKKIVPYTKPNQQKPPIPKKPSHFYTFYTKFQKRSIILITIQKFSAVNTVIPQIGPIQSSTEFVLESRNYNKKILMQISAAAPAAI